MRTLDRKLLRDLWRMRGQMVSIAGVVACGVASVLAMGSTLQSIRASRDDYYERARFAHVFASLKRAPESLARRIAAIPGVATVQTRVTVNASLEVAGLAEPATGHIVSIPAEWRPMLNELHIRRGRYISPGRNDEVLVDEHFAQANHLEIGDSLHAVINGRWERLRIVGIALSPEFVHDIAAGFPMFNDSRHFGILWMGRETLGPLYGMDGAFNDVTIMLAPGAREPEVIARLDALLAPYGGGHAYGRADQPSNNVVEGELEQLAAFGRVMPAIFLAVAAFLLNIVLSRLVATQREEIAVLKAFGYADAAIAVHFLGYALAAVALGLVIGIPLGAWVGTKYTALYAEFFRFPGFHHRTSLSLIVIAVLVSGGAAVIGALSAVRAAAALPPAEGMRPPQPPVFRPLIIERLGYAELLSPAARMILRNLERQPLRALASVLGVASAGAVLVAGTFAFDSAHYLADLQFRSVEREDITVQFTRPLPVRVRQELAHVQGVTAVEPFRTVPVRLRAGHRSRQIVVTGLERGALLRRLVDRRGLVHEIPISGLVLTTTLANVLHVAPGDTIVAELLERGGAERRVVVAALLDELVGTSGYMELGELSRLVGEGPTASGAYLAIDPSAESDALTRLTRLPSIASATTRRAMLESFEATLARSITLTTTVVTLLACVIAVGVLYNGARIALSERGRELASLRVLGFTRREVAAMLLGEQAVIDVAGMPLGLLFGVGLAFAIALAFESELYRFPVVVTARTYLFAIAVISAAGLLAGLAMWRRLNALDLIAVLKTRE